MSRSEKPFVAYRSGRWNLKIVPRNAAGWRALIVWMLALAPITGLFLWFASAEPEGARLWVGLAAYLAAMMIWGLGMMRWMMARSEIVDLEDLLAFKRERDKARRRR
jgi:hypothetical protein